MTTLPTNQTHTSLLPLLAASEPGIRTKTHPKRQGGTPCCDGKELSLEIKRHFFSELARNEVVHQRGWSISGRCSPREQIHQEVPNFYLLIRHCGSPGRTDLNVSGSPSGSRGCFCSGTL